jgi:hypothetical protein
MFSYRNMLLLALLAPSIARAEIPIQYWILDDGTPAVNPARTLPQTTALNLWYTNLAQFKFSGTAVVSEEYLANRSLPAGCDSETLLSYTHSFDANSTLFELSRCLGNPRAINVFVVKELWYAGGRQLNGLAMLDVSLGGSVAPSVVVAANLFFNGAITLSHEIGHVLGFNHTATYNMVGGAPVYFYRQYSCGKQVSYPHFYMPEQWSLEVDAIHKTFPGRRSPMGYLNIYTFVAPSFLVGEYAPVFKQLVNCWNSRSFSESTARSTPSSIRSIAD